ncbi:MAG TPA: tetratricopeptide repeat protein [Rubrivivax sp.]|nr:tetratricopeptide repeat protein [Rubrivivax sp.]
MSKPADWRDVFCGRETELTRLVDAYESVSRESGPRLAVICADRGMGKTRLVQELYRHLSTHFDPDDYWPDASLFKGNNLRVAPDFNDPQTQAHFATFTTAERPLPFLWWGFRLGDPLDRNAVHADMAAHRRTLDPHLERARFAREHAVRHAALRHSTKDVAADAALKIGEALLESVPGVGLGKNLLEVGLGAFKTARMHRQAKLESDRFACTDLATLDAQRVADVYERTLDELAALLEPRDGSGGLPAVVFCDDAQFAREEGDEGALRFLQQLWDRAEKGNWPLLLVATHWAVDWEQDIHGARASFAHHFRVTADDEERATMIRLPKQSDLSALVEQGLPGLPRHDVELLLRKVDGNPQILIELIGLVQRSPAWRSRQGTLSPHGRRSIERHHCNLTKLITERLLSDSTPTAVRLAVALSSVQGMQFMGSLTEAAADALALGPAGEGLATAADPLRLVVGLDAGVASFVQRAYRDAAEAVLDTVCDPVDVKAAVLKAAIDFAGVPAQGTASGADHRTAMLGVVASLGAESADAAVRSYAANALLELVTMASDKAQRAAHARDFEAGIGTKWPLEAFSYEQLDAVRRALSDWYGAGRTVGLCERVAERLRASVSVAFSTETAIKLEEALLAAARAHEARGAYNTAYLLLQERLLTLRRRLAATPASSSNDTLFQALRDCALTAQMSTEHRTATADLHREMLLIRRQHFADNSTPEAREKLIDALLDQWGNSTLAEGIEPLREIVDLRWMSVAEPEALDDAAERLGDALQSLAHQLDEVGRADEAGRAFAEARTVLRTHWAGNPAGPCRKPLAWLLETIAERSGNAGDLAGQRSALLEALDVLGADQGVDVDLDDKLMLQQSLARNAAASGNWKAARQHCLDAEALARKQGDFEGLLQLRSELAGQVPAGTEWLPVDEVDAEAAARAADRERRLATLRAGFADPAMRSAEVCNDLALVLRQRVEELCDAQLWEEAEQAAIECHGVEDWARTACIHQGAYTDAECFEVMGWSLERAGRRADALRVALEIIRLRRQESLALSDESVLVGALMQAAELAADCDELPLAVELTQEWLAIERRSIERDRSRNRLADLLDPLRRLAGYARRLDDRTLHDGVEQERLALGTQMWQMEGDCGDLIEAACGLASSAHVLGDVKTVAELAAQVSSALKEWREQQGIDSDYHSDILSGVSTVTGLVPALALAAAAWRAAEAAAVQAEVAIVLADFATACRDLTKLQNAGVAMRDAGELDLAEPLLRKAVEVATCKHGEDGPEAAAAYSALGRLLALRNAVAEAHRMYRKALTIRERTLGSDAEGTRLLRDRIAELHEVG